MTIAWNTKIQSMVDFLVEIQIDYVLSYRYNMAIQVGDCL